MKLMSNKKKKMGSAVTSFASGADESTRKLL